MILSLYSNNLVLDIKSKQKIKVIITYLNQILPKELINIVLKFIIIYPFYSSVQIISGRYYSGDKDDYLEYALFNKPFGIALDKNNNIVVSDTNNNSIIFPKIS